MPLPYPHPLAAPLPYPSDSGSDFIKLLKINVGKKEFASNVGAEPKNVL